MENQPATQEQTSHDTTQALTDAQIVDSLRSQRSGQPDGELPPSGDSGQREIGEIYLTEDDRAIRHRGYEDFDGKKIPIGTDLDRGERSRDGVITSSTPAQLHDDYHAGGGWVDGKYRETKPRLNKDEAAMAADIMKRDRYASSYLQRLDWAVERRKEIDEELPKLEAELESMKDVDDNDWQSKESERKQDLKSVVRKLKSERHDLGRRHGESFGSRYEQEYDELDRKAREVASTYIQRVYQLNPEYFKNMPTSEFVGISEKLGALEHGKNSFYMESPTQPGGQQTLRLFNEEWRRREKNGEEFDSDAMLEREKTYTAVDYLKGRIEAGDQMTSDEILDILDKLATPDMFDEDIFTSEDTEQVKVISNGFNDRPPKETYQMYVELFQRIGDAVAKQFERNQQKYDEFLEDLKSRRPADIDTPQDNTAN